MNQEMVPFQAVKRKQIADEVAEQLQRKIAVGEWDVGTKIPTEPELMKLFGVGRSTVREAVSVLVHAGLLEKNKDTEPLSANRRLPKSLWITD